jgi:hypothetical protein
MLRGCCRGIAAAILALGLALPLFAAEGARPAGRSFTPPEHLMHEILATQFGLTHPQVMDLHGKGYRYEEIATAANIAARSGRPLAEIVAMRDRNMEWTAIASQCGVAEADMYRPSLRVAGARSMMGSMPMAGASRYAMANMEIDWARRYELTPHEMTRLRAKGLSDAEIYAAANAATLSGRRVDDVVQMIFRGMTKEQIAKELNLSPTSLDDVKPEWRTPQWEQAVRGE